jgi:hypothetical protein
MKKETVSKPRKKRAIYIWWNTRAGVQNTGAQLLKWKKGEERTEGTGEQWKQTWEEAACWDSGGEGVHQNCLFFRTGLILFIGLLWMNLPVVIPSFYPPARRGCLN